MKLRWVMSRKSSPASIKKRDSITGTYYLTLQMRRPAKILKNKRSGKIVKRPSKWINVPILWEKIKD